MMLPAGNILWFLAAIGLLLAGHLLRAARWGLLLGRNDPSELRVRFTALAIGYVVNAVIPLRIGEFVRAMFFATQTKSKLTHAAASIVIERSFDLVAIAVLIAALGLLAFIPSPAALANVASVGGMACVIFALIFATGASARMRRIIWCIASVFNERIRYVLLDTAMALVEIQRSVKSFWLPFFVQSLGMWATYIVSYMVLGKAINLDFTIILSFLYGNLFKPITFEMLEKSGPTALWVVLYSVAPCVLVIAYAKLKHYSTLRLGTTALWWLTDPLLHLSKRTTERFDEAGEYEAFLCRHFSDDASVALHFETHAIQDATVIRLLAGGSDAITAVVQVGPHMRFRKYAVHEAARKLHEQYLWLEEHKEKLPVVMVEAGRMTGDQFLYDMPYSITSRDFYDFIHMNTAETSWAILMDILNSVDRLHQYTSGGEASDETVKAYIAFKVVDNFQLIRNALPELFAQEAFCVNGREIRLETICRFASVDALAPKMKLRGTSIIHGDLTIENMIFDPGHAKGWFLIDPNPGNIFESPLLDYAKLFQSLHLGYESLNRNNPCNYSASGIEFLNPRTLYYEALFGQMCGWIKTRFGSEAYREIRLHEIIHYFRLIPYKIRKSPHAGMLFFGCLCLLIDRYEEEFGG